MKNIVAICENLQSAEAIKLAGKELGINVVCEIQENCKIQNEISDIYKEASDINVCIRGKIDKILHF